MKETMKDIILNASVQMTESCHKTDFIVSRGERCLPDRSCIIRILKDLKRIMFPGYFGEENIALISPQYFIGDRLTDIYGKLKPQIEISLYYRDYEKYTEEEISERAEEVCEEFFKRLPYVQQMLLKDVQAGFDGDPAAKSREDVVISYPGLFAIFVYRIAHELYTQDVPFLPRIMTEYAHSRTGIDINSGAQIGEYFFIDHGTGVVIGETTEIGNNVKLYQGVTLGALSTRMGQQLANVKRHPTICDNVTVYSNSTVLGGETVVGENTIIGGNTFITESIPANTKVSAKSPELVIKKPKSQVSATNVWDY